MGAAAVNKLDDAFIEKQKLRLIALRDSLRRAVRDKEADEAEINAESSGAAVEYEDDAQRLTALELDDNLKARDMARLALVERALLKIAEGNYGLSDASGKPIPVERLEATPEAIHTMQEQERLEARNSDA
jgi:DnaK suppressor protein